MMQGKGEEKTEKYMHAYVHTCEHAHTQFWRKVPDTKECLELVGHWTSEGYGSLGYFATREHVTLKKAERSIF